MKFKESCPVEINRVWQTKLDGKLKEYLASTVSLYIFLVSFCALVYIPHILVYIYFLCVLVYPLYLYIYIPSILVYIYIQGIYIYPLYPCIYPFYPSAYPLYPCLYGPCILILKIHNFLNKIRDFCFVFVFQCMQRENFQN